MTPETWDAILDIAASVLLLLGALLSVAAGVGLLRFPDALSRLHAGTKPQILGLAFVVIAIALASREWAVLLGLIPVIVFQVLSQPVAALMVGRAAYRTGNFRDDRTPIDELARAIDEAEEPPGADASAPPSARR